MQVLLYCPPKGYLLRDELPSTTRFFCVRFLCVLFTLRWLGAGLGVVSGIFGSVFCFTPGILDFAFGLFRGALHLHFRVVCPFARLTLNASCHILNFPFSPILIHFVVSF
jgi:hypothetical protein